jgi:hypothetical protein
MKEELQIAFALSALVGNLIGIFLIVTKGEKK